MAHADRTISADLKGRGSALPAPGGRARAARGALLPVVHLPGRHLPLCRGGQAARTRLPGGRRPRLARRSAEQVHDTAALPQLVDLAQRSPVGFGYAIAVGELLVGLGTSSACWAPRGVRRALISLTLWLTVSWRPRCTTTATTSPI